MNSMRTVYMSKLSVDEISSKSREAFAAIMAPEAQTWGKRELAAWLTGPYAAAARRIPRGESDGPPSSDLDEDRLRLVLARARKAVADMLHEITTRKASLASLAAENDHVGSVRDLKRQNGFVALDRAQMKLEERILSLIMADAFNRTDEYLDTLAVCGHCNSTVFQADSRERGACRCQRTSDVVAKYGPASSDRRVTLRGLGQTG